MAEPKPSVRWRPSRTHLVAGAMVIAGFLLTSVSWWFLLLVGLGTFGPGVLRELGWLHDRDEFQRRADHRAGYLAFLTVGLVAIVFVAFFRAGGTFEHPQRLVSFLLVLLWFTWMFSSLLAYWGAQKTAARVLIAFGAVWLVFTIMSNVGSEWTGWAALLLHPLLAAPFFVLAWVSTRWPRLAGVLLLVTFAGAFVLLEVPRIARDGSILAVIDDGGLVLFLGPLIAGGIALLTTSGRDDEDETAERDVQHTMATESGSFL